jgi:hypothetical protein
MDHELQNTYSNFTRPNQNSFVSQIWIAKHKILNADIQGHYFYLTNIICQFPAAIPKRMSAGHFVGMVYAISEPAEKDKQYWLVKIMPLY